MPREKIIHTAIIFQLTVLFPLLLLSVGGQAAEIWQQKSTVNLEETLSAKEKEWFETFQKGTFYTCGWKDISLKVLEKTPEKSKGELRQALEDLGTKIGCEWSKSNEKRKINNDMLEQWGRLLKQTADQEPALIPQVVATINQKVLTLLD